MSSQTTCILMHVVPILMLVEGGQLLPIDSGVPLVPVLGPTIIGSLVSRAHVVTTCMVLFMCHANALTLHSHALFTHLLNAMVLMCVFTIYRGREV